MKLRVHEIFYSLQGESSRVGLPTVFVRLTGCPMRCVYCDTAYAFHGGQSLELSDILAEVARLGAHYVTVTGGEPLAQKECETLLRALCDAGHDVSLETGGAMDISRVDARVSVILDIKPPDSSTTALFITPLFISPAPHPTGLYAAAPACAPAACPAISIRRAQ